METPEINRVVETIAPVFVPIAFFEGQVYLGLFSFIIAVSGLIPAGELLARCRYRRCRRTMGLETGLIPSALDGIVSYWRGVYLVSAE